MKSQNQPAAITGNGTLASGTAFYLVSSSSEVGRSHVVTCQPGHLTCDCRGFFYRGKCAHIALVDQELANDETAVVLPPVRWGGRSQAAFSLMK